MAKFKILAEIRMEHDEENAEWFDSLSPEDRERALRMSEEQLKAELFDTAKHGTKNISVTIVAEEVAE